MMKSSKKSNILYIVLSSVLIVLASISSYYLFYRYFVSPCVDVNGYLSDFPTHYSTAISGTGYSLAHLMMKILYLCGYPRILIPLLFTCLILLTIFATAYFIYKYIDVQNISLSKVLCLATSFLFLCNLFIPIAWPHFYFAQTLVTQAWHNSTYIFMRVFAILAFLYFILIYKNRYEKSSWLHWVLFTLFMILANFSKPNFCLIFIPSLFIFLLFELIISKGKLFWFCFKLAISLILSSAILALPYFVVYGSGDGSYVGLYLGRFINAFLHWRTIGALISNLLLPLFLTIVLIKCNIKNNNPTSFNIIVLLWVMAVIGLFQNIFVGDIGPRLNDGNFSWGIYSVMYLLILCLLCEWYKNKDMICLQNHGNALYRGGYVIYSLYIICGVIYYIWLLLGYYYMV